MKSVQIRTDPSYATVTTINRRYYYYGYYVSYESLSQFPSLHLLCLYSIFKTREKEREREKA